MVFEINPNFEPFREELLTAFQNFENAGTDFFIGDRNKIKVFEIQGVTVNIKSFKIPVKTNQIIYKYFRKSKAQRSFENAKTLLKNNIPTPTPIAYQENYGDLGLQKSFYASIHQDYDFTFRELIEDDKLGDKENILKQFAGLCYNMHRAGIEFKDHSPGNTIIKDLHNGKYDFHLVDLNRMSFHFEEAMDRKLRMKNLSKLTPKKEMVRIISREYAGISGENPNELFEMFWKYTSGFFTKTHRKENAMMKLKPLLNVFLG